MRKAVGLIALFLGGAIGLTQEGCKTDERELHSPSVSISDGNLTGKGYISVKDPDRVVETIKIYLGESYEVFKQFNPGFIKQSDKPKEYFFDFKELNLPEGRYRLTVEVKDSLDRNGHTGIFVNRH